VRGRRGKEKKTAKTKTKTKTKNAKNDKTFFFFFALLFSPVLFSLARSLARSLLGFPLCRRHAVESRPERNEESEETE